MAILMHLKECMAARDEKQQTMCNGGGGVGGGEKKPFNKAKQSEKVPRRGLGVAELEKIRREQQQRNTTITAASLLYKSPNPIRPLNSPSMSFIRCAQLCSINHKNELASPTIAVHPKEVPLNKRCGKKYIMSYNVPTPWSQEKKRKFESMLGMKLQSPSYMNATFSNKIPPSNSFFIKPIHENFAMEDKLENLNTGDDGSSLTANQGSSQRFNVHGAKRIKENGRSLYEDHLLLVSSRLAPTFAHQLNSKIPNYYMNKGIINSGDAIVSDHRINSSPTTSTVKDQLFVAVPPSCGYPQLRSTQDLVSMEVDSSQCGSEQKKPFYHFFPTGPNSSESEANEFLSDGVDLELKL